MQRMKAGFQIRCRSPDWLPTRKTLALIFHLPSHRKLQVPVRSISKSSENENRKFDNKDSPLHAHSWLHCPCGQLSPSSSPRRHPSVLSGEQVSIINAISGGVFTQGRKLNINIPRRKVSCHFCEALAGGQSSPPKSTGTYRL